MEYMDYSKASKWIVGERIFQADLLGKCEAVMCLGNGYMGLRSATEERYLNERRNLFIAGTFNKFNDDEVTELPNAADVLAMDIEVNGEMFNLEKGTVKAYSRELNIRTGELIRTVTWVSPKGDELDICFRRVVSKRQLHCIAQQITIKPKSGDIRIKVVSGINGRMTNSGSQHFSEGDKRLFEKVYMQYTQTTSESDIDFVFTTGLKFYQENGQEHPMDSRIIMDRRTIDSEYKGMVSDGQSLIIEKITDVRTSRDKEYQGSEWAVIRDEGLAACKGYHESGYQVLALRSADEWEEQVWQKVPIRIESEDPLDQLAIHFAQYHLYVMTPAHDARMNIGAKGLSGEGYKGHTFWDTDIFALPYFTFSDPKIARQLEEYRYLSLPGAHQKAKENGFLGAQYPWESAWLDDGEVTPVWGAADIITGLPTKIWSGFIEQHITSDVAYGIWQYYCVTGDQDFMDRYGYELIMDTAKFWVTRLEYSQQDGRYHLNDVVGPDEYKEHADDNAFTNYMAHWNIGKAMEYSELLKQEKPEIYKRLNKKLELDKFYPLWRERHPAIFLPQPREDNVIAQDAAYLGLKEIDLRKYKEQEQVGTMFLDYNLEQVNKIQVSKQADIMILFFLLEDQFTQEVKKANWDYYEPRTLHDSSLSLSTHTILACDMKEKRMAYDLFKRARAIDLGPNMKSSNDGIHAASLAGIWQSTVFGFGGVRMLNGKLRIEPVLPAAWTHLSFVFYWRGEKLNLSISHDKLTVENQTQKQVVCFEHKGIEYNVSDVQEIKL